MSNKKHAPWYRNLSRLRDSLPSDAALGRLLGVSRGALQTYIADRYSQQPPEHVQDRIMELHGVVMKESRLGLSACIAVHQTLERILACESLGEAQQEAGRCRTHISEQYLGPLMTLQELQDELDNA